MHCNGVNGFDIKNYPLLKLALPLVAGIVTGWLCSVDVLHTATLFVVSLLLLAAGMLSPAPRWLFGAGVVGVMLSVGIFVITCDKETENPKWSGEKGVFEAQLLEVPHRQGVATRALARVRQAAPVSVAGARNEGVVQLYFANSVEAEALNVGDKVRFEGAVQNPANNGNPAEFDAVRYMRVKGITGSVYLPISSWEFQGAGERDIPMLALSLREKVLDMYERLGFKGDDLALLSAFSVGERRGFPHYLSDAYAAAGVSHVLALSGLHLGMFYMVVAALFSLMGGGRKAFIIRELLVLLLLWAFAFVAGLTPSVVRAATLFTLVGVGRCLRREGAALNSLAVAAVAMLLVSPRLLFDVGFQLSFSSVAAILLLLPWLRRVLRCDAYGRVYEVASSLVAVSLAAQVGVFPFVWYYFGTFPLYFLFANLLLVPLASLLMLLAVGLWLTAFCSIIQLPFVWLLSQLLSLMNGVVDYVASLPAASVMLPQVSVPGACFAALLLAVLLWSAMNRRLWVTLLLAVVVCAVVLLNVFATRGSGAGDALLLFNNRKMAAVLAVTAGGDTYMLSSVPQFDADCDHVVMPYVKRECLKEPCWAADGYCDSVLECAGGLVSFGGLRVQMLADDCWLADSVQCPVDALLLCRGFLGPVEEVLFHYPARCVILDGSLYEGSRRRLLRECRQAGVTCVDISQAGALKLVGQGDDFSLEFMRGK